MGQYIYRIRPSRLEMLSEGPTPFEEGLVGLHFDYLSDLAKQGVVLLAGRTPIPGEHSFGIVIFEAEDDDAAAMVVENDPAVRAGVMLADWYPFRVAILTEQLDSWKP